MTSWKTIRLGDALSISHGYAFRGEHFREQGDLIVLTPGNFCEEGGFKDKDGKEKYYDGPLDPRFLLAESEVVVAMTEQSKGLLGSTATIPCGNVYLHNQRIGLIRIEDPSCLNLRFVYHLLNAPFIRQQIQATATGSKVRHTAPDRLGALEVAVPDVEYQRKVGKTLDGLESLIGNNRRRIEILEEVARLLYREWFVHFRFPGHKSVDLVDFDSGPMPAGWTRTRLADVCSLVMGQSPKSEHYNRVGDGLPFHQGVKDFGDRFPIHTTWTTVDKRVAESGDVLFSVRAPVGRINVAPDRLVVGRGLCAIRALDGSQNFLLQQLKSTFAIEDTIGGGTIFNAVTKQDMESIGLLIPSESVVGDFEAIIAPIADLIGILSQLNVALCETRGLLLPHLVSGKFDISDLDVDSEAVGV